MGEEARVRELSEQRAGDTAAKRLRRKESLHTGGSEDLKVRRAFLCQVVTDREELGTSQAVRGTRREQQPHPTCSLTCSVQMFHRTQPSGLTAHTAESVDTKWDTLIPHLAPKASALLKLPEYGHTVLTALSE